MTATDTTNSTITGSAVITVSSSATTHFVVTAPASETAGTSFQVTVTAEDSNNNTTAGYTGTVHFTSSDVQAGLPADTTLTNGTGIFTVTLKTSGTQTITATDKTIGNITGSDPVTVIAGAAHSLLGRRSDHHRGRHRFCRDGHRVDSFNNVATGYTGTVHLATTDTQAHLPGNSTLNSRRRLLCQHPEDGRQCKPSPPPIRSTPTSTPPAARSR